MTKIGERKNDLSSIEAHQAQEEEGRAQVERRRQETGDARMKPKSHRLCANCGNCKHGDSEDSYYDEYRVTCVKHNFVSGEWWICDDYEA